MKRAGQLWPQVVAFENLYRAARQAQAGKRFRDNVLDFNHNLEQNLFQLQTELQNKTYQPGIYRIFEIKDPKPRLISAAPYRDRVVHHALCNIIVPRIERSFIDDSYANQIGKGTHRALDRAIPFARSSQFVLQCDIFRYFPSIDQLILKQQLREFIKCRETLWLIDTILDSSPVISPTLNYLPGDNLLTPLDRRVGLPIGNLTSQFFANVYLNKFDHFVKQTLKCHKYLRFVDDFLLFGNDRIFLANARREIADYLMTLRLMLHPQKTQLFETQRGVNFVGFRILPDRIRVRNDNLRRSRIRLKRLQKDCIAGKLNLKKLVERLQSWEAHLKHGDTHRLRRHIFAQYSFIG